MYLRGLLLTQEVASSLGHSIPVLMRQEVQATSWYTATGLLGQGRGVQVFAVEAGTVSPLTRRNLTLSRADSHTLR